MKRSAALIALTLIAFPVSAEDAPPPLPTKTRIGATKTVRHVPNREEILADSKPAKLSIIDSLILKIVQVRMGAGKTAFLVNRISDEVEYVWSPNLRRFIRPHFVMLGAQATYDRWRSRQ
jgi:hypothetical protein